MYGLTHPPTRISLPTHPPIGRPARCVKGLGHVSKTAPSARHEARSAPFAYELRPLLCVADSDDSQLTCPRALRAWWRLV